MNIRYSPTTGSFYPYDIDYATLPDDLIDISMDDYAAAMNRPTGHAFAFPGGQLVISAPPAATLDELKAAKLAELATAFTAAIANVKAGYPADEVSSWPEQKAEAFAYTADNTAPTPLLSGIAGERGITLADLVARVLTNAAAWSVTSGKLIGKRQAYEDQVSAAQDPAGVALITWVS